jgi:type III secretory pathway component EscT
MDRTIFPTEIELNHHVSLASPMCVAFNTTSIIVFYVSGSMALLFPLTKYAVAETGIQQAAEHLPLY